MMRPSGLSRVGCSRFRKLFLTKNAIAPWSAIAFCVASYVDTGTSWLSQESEKSGRFARLAKAGLGEHFGGHAVTPDKRGNRKVAYYHCGFLNRRAPDRSRCSLSSSLLNTIIARANARLTHHRKLTHYHCLFIAAWRMLSKSRGGLPRSPLGGNTPLRPDVRALVSPNPVCGAASCN